MEMLRQPYLRKGMSYEEFAEIAYAHAKDLMPDHPARQTAAAIILLAADALAITRNISCEKILQWRRHAAAIAAGDSNADGDGDGDDAGAGALVLALMLALMLAPVLAPMLTLMLTMT
jgi:hypothetical protein